jgi:hypothetical protein
MDQLGHHRPDPGPGPAPSRALLQSLPLFLMLFLSNCSVLILQREHSLARRPLHGQVFPGAGRRACHGI